MEDVADGRARERAAGASAAGQHQKPKPERGTSALVSLSLPSTCGVKRARQSNVFVWNASDEKLALADRHGKMYLSFPKQCLRLGVITCL